MRRSATRLRLTALTGGLCQRAVAHALKLRPDGRWGLPGAACRHLRSAQSLSRCCLSPPVIDGCRALSPSREPQRSSGRGRALTAPSVLRHEVRGALRITGKASTQRRVDKISTVHAWQMLARRRDKFIDTRAQLLRQAEVALHACGHHTRTCNALVDDRHPGFVALRRKARLYRRHRQGTHRDVRRPSQILEQLRTVAIKRHRRLHRATRAVKRHLSPITPQPSGARASASGRARPRALRPTWPRVRRLVGRQTHDVWLSLGWADVQRALDPDRAQRQPTCHHAAHRSAASPISSPARRRIASAPT